MIRNFLLVAVASLCSLCVNCGGSGPPSLLTAFTVSIVAAGDFMKHTIVQGGETAFDVGTLQIGYEIAMSNGVSGTNLLTTVSGLPDGVAFVPTSQEFVDTPQNLEAGSVFQQLVTLNADNTAEPGSYEITITVIGAVSSSSEVAVGSASFVLEVLERE